MFVQISSRKRSAPQFTFGGMTLAAVTLICVYLQAHFAAAAFAYMLVVLLFSLMGIFIASSALCVAAIAVLAYYFAPPAFSLRFDDPTIFQSSLHFLLSPLRERT
ncbi:K+-sensing histidine kinase KdpD [Bradyrhizobium sp. USDA 4471]